MELRSRIALAAALLGLLPANVTADELRYVVSGIQEPLLGNVRQHLERFGFTETSRLSARRFDELSAEAEERVREALKPYGYYHPEITTNLIRLAGDTWRMRIEVRRGEPVRVGSADIVLAGDGAEHGRLREWRRDWPLPPGAILNQPLWESAKKEALSLAAAHGFLDARFGEQRIAIDLGARSAALRLVLDTGPQALFGDISYSQELLRPWVLENVPRFVPGTPYNAELLEQFRLDLWRTGYFTEIDVRERRVPDSSPPVVDLDVTLAASYRDTYQGSFGFGNQSGLRLQGLWSRHRLSRRGDRVDLGIGYRETDDEISTRVDYRIPRRTADREFWVASANYSSDNQDLEFKRDIDDKNFVRLANGQVDDLEVRFGRLFVRDRKQGFQQIFETVFVEAVRDNFDYRPGPAAAPEVLALASDPRFGGLFQNTINTFSVGIEWDWPALRGSGFETEGHREQAWLFTSNDAWGSERNFTQVYLSSRRSYLYGDRYKLMLRAEVGYSDVDVRELAGSVDGEPFELSLTQLPDTYRFKAGGASSVRGYGFEALSDNDVGSSNVVTASAEIEMKIAPKWSLAAFADIGNAFNDWDERKLRKGAGFGVRWYTIAGAIRVDIARGLDIAGKPWRLHVNVGSPLL